MGQITGSEKVQDRPIEICRQTTNLTFEFLPHEDDYLLVMRATI